MDDRWSRLDGMVEEYIRYRQSSSNSTSTSTRKGNNGDHHHHQQQQQSSSSERKVAERILNAVSSGDYPRALSLWDAYVIQRLDSKSPSIVAEAYNTEFLANLFLALYPFRREIIQSAGTPKIASTVAARSMTIFKHFIETRGLSIIQKYPDYAKYKNLHKIAFPPTHPQYKHLFTEEWISRARKSISVFLDNFFEPGLPDLCQMFEGRRSDVDGDSSSRSYYKKRENMFMKFSMSMSDLTNDLISVIENGKSIDKKQVMNFKAKFDEIKSMMMSAVPNDEKSDGTESKQQQQQQQQQQQLVISPSARKRFVDGMIASTISGDYMEEYNAISSQLMSISKDISDNILELTTGAIRLSSADADSLCTTTMMGCMLTRTIYFSIVRPDKEIQSKSSREAVIQQSTRFDVLGICPVGSSKDSNADSRVTQVDYGTTKFLISLVKCMQQIPMSYVTCPSSVDAILAPKVDEGGKFPPHERIMFASILFAEYVCRLIISVSMAKAGEDYLKKSGYHLTIALVDLVNTLPLPNYPAPQMKIESTGTTEDDEVKSAHPYTTSEIQPSKYLEGLYLNSIMALTILTAWTKHHQLALIKRGGINWLSKTLHNLLNYNAANEQKYGSVIVFMLDSCLALVAICVQSLEAQRLMVASNKSMKETEALIQTLLSVILLAGKSRCIGKSHAEYAYVILKKLFSEIVTRQVARDVDDIKKLQNAVKNKTIIISVDKATELLQMVDSDVIQRIEQAEAQLDPGEVEEIVNAIWIAHANLRENAYVLQYLDKRLPQLARLTSSPSKEQQREDFIHKSPMSDDSFGQEQHSSRKPDNSNKTKQSNKEDEDEDEDGNDEEEDDDGKKDGEGDDDDDDDDNQEENNDEDDDGNEDDNEDDDNGEDGNEEEEDAADDDR